MELHHETRKLFVMSRSDVYDLSTLPEACLACSLLPVSGHRARIPSPSLAQSCSASAHTGTCLSVVFSSSTICSGTSRARGERQRRNAWGEERDVNHWWIHSRLSPCLVMKSTVQLSAAGLCCCFFCFFPESRLCPGLCVRTQNHRGFDSYISNRSWRLPPRATISSGVLRRSEKSPVKVPHNSQTRPATDTHLMPGSAPL